MGVNKVILIGNLGKDPEIRNTPNQVAVASFSLATSERRKDASGNWVDHTEWHRIVAFSKLAEFCGSYLTKGKQVYIEGKIRTNKWQDREGKDRYTTEILADTIQFVGRKESGDSSYGAPLAEPELPPRSGEIAGLKTADALDGSAGASDDVPFDDDDIPF